MNSFKDTKGRTWTIDINVGSLKRVKSTLGRDLLGGKDNEFADLTTDIVALVDTIFVLVKPQADAIGVTDEQFAEGLGGDVVEQAADAFRQAYIDFFPSARRGILQKADAKVRAAETKMLERLNAKVESPEFENQITKKLNEILGSDSTSSPGSAA